MAVYESLLAVQNCIIANNAPRSVICAPEYKGAKSSGSESGSDSDLGDREGGEPGDEKGGGEPGDEGGGGEPGDEGGGGEPGDREDGEPGDREDGEP